jgi:hypothetical protein
MRASFAGDLLTDIEAYCNASTPMDQLYMVRAHAPRPTLANKWLPRMPILSEKDPRRLGVPFERFEHCLLSIQDRRLRFCRFSGSGKKHGL